MARRLVVVLLQGLVLVALVVGATLWAVQGKRVTVAVDAQRRVVNTRASSVEDILGRAGITVGKHDLVAPSRNAKITDGGMILVQRGRPVDITLDGRPHRIWVTAATVDELLDQLAGRNGLWLSASRSKRIPLSGIQLTARTPKEATVVADGRPAVLMTTVATVRELLAQNHVTLAERDRASAPLDTAVRDGMIVTVTRVRGAIRTVDVASAQPVTRKADATLYKGQTKVLKPGAPGVVQQTWQLTLVNGKVTGKRLLRQVARSVPVTRIVAYGTKARPTATPRADGLNWAALAECESGGNPKAFNAAGYYGLYQFDVGTWHSVGGSGVPSDASAAEQTARAQTLYARRGASPWPVCGARLYS